LTLLELFVACAGRAAGTWESDPNELGGPSLGTVRGNDVAFRGVEGHRVVHKMARLTSLPDKSQD
jgi:hypothetical protein